MSEPSFLEKTNVGDLLSVKPHRKLISINIEASLEMCLETLLKNYILSAPVFDSQENKFVGIIELLDVARYLMKEPMFNNESVGNDSYSQYVFSSQIVRGLVSTFESCRQIHIVRHQDSLKDLMQVLLSDHRHRALVSIEEGGKKEFQMISQTDILKYLYSHLDEIGNIGNRTIQSLNIIKDPKTISATEKALEGFKKLTSHKKNALAVIDDHGKLISQLSTSNLRGLKGENLNDLLLPVMDFVKSKETARDHTITCKEDSTLREIMHTALTSKTHRVWLVQSNGIPTGVVSFSGIVSAFLEYCG